MKTKKCPNCNAEISEEAILCKFCHSLLIDDQNEAPGEADLPSDEESTIVFNKQQLQQDDRTRIFSAAQVNEQYNNRSVSDSKEDTYGSENDDYEEYDEEEYDDYDVEDDNNYEETDPKKKTFMIAAVITIGILVIVIIAVIVGYKIFGFSGGDDSSDDLDGIVDKASSSQSLNDTSDDKSSVQQNDPQSTADNSSESKTETSSSDDTSSETEDSSEASSVSEDSSAADSSQTDASSSSPDTSSVSDSSSSNDSSAADTSSAAGASSVPGTVDDSTIIASVSSQISGTISSYEFRSDDGNYRYYYIFTEDNHGYSVAYNKNTGESVVVQSY